MAKKRTVCLYLSDTTIRDLKRRVEDLQADDIDASISSLADKCISEALRLDAIQRLTTDTQKSESEA